MVRTSPSSRLSTVCGAPVLRIDEAEFAHDAAGRQFDADLLHQEAPGHGVEHLVGRIALAEQDVAFLVFARAHERPQPVHRQIALRGRPRLLHQREHLAQPDHVDRQREQIEKERRNRAGERAVADEEHDADDADDAQRHDGAHHQRRDVEDGADQRQHVGECDIGEDDVDQPVEHRVIGDVGRIEAELDQELFDPADSAPRIRARD